MEAALNGSSTLTVLSDVCDKLLNCSWKRADLFILVEAWKHDEQGIRGSDLDSIEHTRHIGGTFDVRSHFEVRPIGVSSLLKFVYFLQFISMNGAIIAPDI